MGDIGGCMGDNGGAMSSPSLDGNAIDVGLSCRLAEPCGVIRGDDTVLACRRYHRARVRDQPLRRPTPLRMGNIDCGSAARVRMRDDAGSLPASPVRRAVLALLMALASLAVLASESTLLVLFERFRARRSRFERRFL